MRDAGFLGPFAEIAEIAPQVAGGFDAVLKLEGIVVHRKHLWLYRAQIFVHIRRIPGWPAVSAVAGHDAGIRHLIRREPAVQVGELPAVGKACRARLIPNIVAIQALVVPGLVHPCGDFRLSDGFGQMGGADAAQIGAAVVEAAGVLYQQADAADGIRCLERGKDRGFGAQPGDLNKIEPGVAGVAHNSLVLSRGRVAVKRHEGGQQKAGLIAVCIRLSVGQCGFWLGGRCFGRRLRWRPVLPCAGSGFRRRRGGRAFGVSGRGCGAVRYRRSAAGRVIRIGLRVRRILSRHGRVRTIGGGFRYAAGLAGSGKQAQT